MIHNFKFPIKNKFPDQHFSAVLDQELYFRSANFLKLKIKSNTCYIHNIPDAVGNNIRASSPIYASILFVFAIKLIFCQSKLLRHTPMFLLPHFLFCFVAKKGFINKIFIKNQLPVKNSQIRVFALFFISNAYLQKIIE